MNVRPFVHSLVGIVTDGPNGICVAYLAATYGSKRVELVTIAGTGRSEFPYNS